LDAHRILILATCADGRMTAKAVSCVHVELEIYFQTSGQNPRNSYPPSLLSGIRAD
jgi:hypothetical protein